MTTIDTPEQILCLRRDDLPVKWLGQRTVEKMTEMKFYAALANTPYYWVPRDKAEADTQYKQLIPYVILQTESSSLTACYQRNGTEKRLHDLWSVGIGGHINSEDCIGKNDILPDIVKNGMIRELEEELPGLSREAEPALIGIINEEETNVGNVHLGLVYSLAIDAVHHLKPDDELSRFTFIPTGKVLDLNLEIWSNLAMYLILQNKIHTQGGDYKPAKKNCVQKKFQAPVV